jgi:hypothetical protein
VPTDNLVRRPVGDLAEAGAALRADLGHSGMALLLLPGGADRAFVARLLATVGDLRSEPKAAGGRAATAFQVGKALPALPLHTDGSQTPQPPGHVALQCVRPDDDGFGVSTFVAVDEVVAAALETDEGVQAVDELSQEQFVEGILGSFRAPALIRSGAGWRARFNRKNLEAGWAASGRPGMFAGPATFLRCADRAQQAAGIAYQLGPGELVVFDNARYLHARTRLSGRGRRVVERYKIGANTELPYTTCAGGVGS